MEWLDVTSSLEQAIMDMYKMRNRRKDSFCASWLNLYIKYDDETCKWIGHSKTKPIEIDELRKRKEPNDITDTKNHVPENQSEGLSAKSKQIDKYASVNSEDQTEYASLNPQKMHI